MKLLRSVILIGLFSGGTPAAAPAQYSFEKPVLISKESGLPSNHIRAVTTDFKGFVWAGTSEGLCRFDGYLAKTYTDSGRLSSSLLDNSVFTVLPVGEQLWTGTSQGISVLDTKPDTFRHYQLTNNGKTATITKRFDQYISVLYRDRSGTIWVGTRERGVFSYDEKRDDFRRYPLPKNKYPALLPSLGSDQSILSIIESPQNDSFIWAGTAAGLQKINRFTGEVLLYCFPRESKDYQVALNAFRRLYQHDDGLLYVGSWGAGVNVFDPIRGTFSPLPLTGPEGKKIVLSVISGFHRKNADEFWISGGAGIALYNTRLKKITWHKQNIPAEHAYYGISHLDASGRAWLATINGLSLFDPAMQQFSTYSFRHLSFPEWAFATFIIPDKQGRRITVCPLFADGLLHLDRQSGTWTKIPFPGNQTFTTERDVIRGFVQLASGDYVIAADRGIFRYAEKERRLTAIHEELPVAAPTRRGAILLDRRGNLWIADDIQGLIKWEPERRRYKVYLNSVEPGGSAATGRITHFFEDSRGNIWFQKGAGMGVYLPGPDTIQVFDYSRDTSNSFPVIHAFTEDKNGRVWASAGSGWLGYALSAEPHRGLIQKINISNRGISGNIPRLATDTEGNTWGYTAKELVKISAGDLSVSTYSFQYGAGEADFYHFSFLPTGEMVFGGRNGIMLANPAALRRNAELPVPYIAGIRIFHQDFPLKDSGETLRLRPNQNFFAISFSAIAYTLSADVKFRWRLRGFDDWGEPSSRRFANYTNVPGGRYVFQLQAANNEGTWNEEILELPVWVGTAFWKTTWFWLALLLLLAGGLWALYRYRLNQIRKKEQLKSAYEKKIANVEMSSLLSQMNPHFIFNSLNSIDSYILKSETQKASEYLNNFARLMRLILQHSRSNYITLADEQEALELYMQMEQMRFKQQFSYRVQVDENIDPAALLIPPMLIQPFVENAIWHGLMQKTDGEAGRVDIRFELKDQLLQCTVEDNGIGRAKAAALRANKTGNRKKSMGIQITLDRIEMINKLYGSHTSVEITDLHDREGNPAGTRVLLRIPV